MALEILLLLPCLLVGTVLGGSECPPREDIYPCSCANIPIGKRLFHTVVSCHRLESTDSLQYILPALRSMQIDQMYIYDSFWDRHDLKLKDEQKVMPQDWLSLKVKELEIVDTSLSSCFACNVRKECRNVLITKFSAVNSSSHENFCGLCNTPKNFPWLACMSKLREFHFRQSSLKKVSLDLFPQTMSELATVDLSYNMIEKVESGAFSNTPRLKILNLSHNNLVFLNRIFTTSMEYLEELHLSWNKLKSFAPDIFPRTKKLKNLQLDNNLIRDLKEEDWKGPPESMIVVNLMDNPIHCDCSIQWINRTFAVKVGIQGFCATPEEYQKSRIRRASINLNERCDEDGNVGNRKRTTAAAPAATYFPVPKRVFHITRK